MLNNSQVFFLTFVLLFLLIAVPGFAQDKNGRLALPYSSGLKIQEICGQNNQIEVEYYKGELGVSVDYVRQNESSTVLLQWLSKPEIQEILPDYFHGKIAGRNWCTGTLISPMHILTAGHCLKIHPSGENKTPYREGESGKRVWAQPKQLARIMKVHFGYQKDGDLRDTRTTIDYPVIKLVEYGIPSKVDYAILELETSVPEHVAIPAQVLKRGPIQNELISIIQHPNGETKKIDVGTVSKFNDHELFYDDLDTLSASSGSGVRDSEGKLIAVHTRGGCEKGNGFNRGTTTAQIYAVSEFLKM